VVVGHAFPVLCWHFKMNYGVHIGSPSPTINVLKSVTPQGGNLSGRCQKEKRCHGQIMGLEPFPVWLFFVMQQN
jgi:hypothetical protein